MTVTQAFKLAGISITIGVAISAFAGFALWFTADRHPKAPLVGVSGLVYRLARLIVAPSILVSGPPVVGTVAFYSAVAFLILIGLALRPKSN